MGLVEFYSTDQTNSLFSTTSEEEIAELLLDFVF